MSDTKIIINDWIRRLNVLEKYPLMLILDITNVCNFTCPHCPQPAMAAQAEYRASYLDYNTYTSMIDEVNGKGVKFIRFTGNGEPLLHKRFVDMIAYAKSKSNIPLVLTTNGSRLDEIMSESILNLGIDVIDISLDAFTKEKFNIVRAGGDYHQVMSNIHQLLFLRKKNKSKTKIIVNMINQDSVKDEVSNFQQYWTPLVDFVLVRNLHTATKRVNQFEVANKMDMGQPERHPCAHLWKRLTVDYKLNVKFCAHDWFEETVLAKLDQEGIAKVWFNQRLNEIRQAHLAGDYSKAAICGDCPDWAAAPWDYGYESVIEKIGVIQISEQTSPSPL